MSPGSPLFSIGHSNQSIEEFIALLQAHSIAVVADVRSTPYSAYTPQFNRDVLEARLPHCHIRYVFLGAELGGRPADGSMYDAEGHVLYDALAKTPLFRRGADRLLLEASRARVAVMCSEEDPTACHRHLLIAWALRDGPVDMLHIRADATLHSARELLEQAVRSPDAQLQLFNVSEAPRWRSLRSVLPKDARKNSSER